MNKKKVFITGITGQDGSYLAEFLLEKGYEVHGLVRRVSKFNRERIDFFHNQITLHYGDLTDSSSLHELLGQIQPDEIYNLASQSHVGVSFHMPEFTGDITGLSVVRLLATVQEECPKARFYQASSSEMFGDTKERPQTEHTPFRPRSPYAAAKAYAHWMAVNYREAYGMYVCNGILFNHESPRRGENFVTKKITDALAQIMVGKIEKFSLGNMDAARDWGYAKDYVEGMWQMMQQEKPDDYILATNETHTVREFVEEACRVLSIDLVWEGKAEKEKGLDRKTGKVIVEIDPRYFRPAEVVYLQGDYSKARNKFGWQPKVKFKELVKIMLESDLKKYGFKP